MYRAETVIGCVGALRVGQDHLDALCREVVCRRADPGFTAVCAIEQHCVINSRIFLRRILSVDLTIHQKLLQIFHDLFRCVQVLCLCQIRRYLGYVLCAHNQTVIVSETCLTRQSRSLFDGALQRKGSLSRKLIIGIRQSRSCDGHGYLLVGSCFRCIKLSSQTLIAQACVVAVQQTGDLQFSDETGVLHFIGQLGQNCQGASVPGKDLRAYLYLRLCCRILPVDCICRRKYYFIFGDIAVLDLRSGISFCPGKGSVRGRCSACQCAFRQGLSIGKVGRRRRFADGRNRLFHGYPYRRFDTVIIGCIIRCKYYLIALIVHRRFHCVICPAPGACHRLLRIRVHCFSARQRTFCQGLSIGKLYCRRRCRTLRIGFLHGDVCCSVHGFVFLICRCECPPYFSSAG